MSYNTTLYIASSVSTISSNNTRASMQTVISDMPIARYALGICDLCPNFATVKRLNVDEFEVHYCSLHYDAFTPIQQLLQKRILDILYPSDSMDASLR